MALGEHSWDFKRIIRFFTKEEVKTPLAFLFKAIAYLTAAWIAILYSPVSDELKYTLIKFSAFIFLVLCFAVLLFAWFNPRNLVYGEAGHRAEHKLEFGTEKKTVTEEQLKDLVPVQNKNQLTKQ
jgi:hypothetical protein